MGFHQIVNIIVSFIHNAALRRRLNVGRPWRARKSPGVTDSRSLRS
jgi:hypothetical protein